MAIFINEHLKLGAPPDNVSFSVVDPTGAIDYCQEVRQADGSLRLTGKLWPGKLWKLRVKRRGAASIKRSVTGFCRFLRLLSSRSRPWPSRPCPIRCGSRRQPPGPLNVCFGHRRRPHQVVPGLPPGRRQLGRGRWTWAPGSAPTASTRPRPTPPTPASASPRASATFSVRSASVAFGAAVSDGTLRLRRPASPDPQRLLRSPPRHASPASGTRATARPTAAGRGRWTWAPDSAPTASTRPRPAPPTPARVLPEASATFKRRGAGRGLRGRRRVRRHAAAQGVRLHPDPLNVCFPVAPALGPPSGTRATPGRPAAGRGRWTWAPVRPTASTHGPGLRHLRRRVPPEGLGDVQRRGADRLVKTAVSDGAAAQGVASP